MTIDQTPQQVTIEFGRSSPVTNGASHLRPLENGVNHSQKNANGSRHLDYDNMIGNVIDIRKEQIECSLSESLRTCIRGSKDKGPCFPTMFLWNEKGLKLFEAVTHLKEYYLNQIEMEILEQRSDDIARRIKPKTMVIDLGSGQVLFLQQCMTPDTQSRPSFKPLRYVID